MKCEKKWLILSDSDPHQSILLFESCLHMTFQEELRALFERSRQAGHVAPSRGDLRNMLKEAGCPDDENTLNVSGQEWALNTYHKNGH